MHKGEGNAHRQGVSGNSQQLSKCYVSPGSDEETILSLVGIPKEVKVFR